MRGPAIVGAMLLAAAVPWSSAAAQASGSSGSGSGQGPYTLQVNSRVVLTDVTVTDKQGNPVTGLPQSEFRIFDNGREQKLASFEEHREKMATLQETAAAPDSFSNDVLRHPPPQVNAILFDTTTIDMLDQMVLFQEMKRFVAKLPAGEPVAIFTRSGQMTLQLASFTDDRAALMAAIERAIPKFQRPGAWMASDLQTLQQMTFYLGQIRGRKNLIWFTSGSNLFLRPDPTTLPDYKLRRDVYDMLEAERIAIYPIDARGLTVDFSMGMASQQMLMRQDAAATGGAAYVNTNGLALAAQHIVSTDGNYYTLTYSPQDLKNNESWHRVQVKLEEKGYQLSYRHGYFDDGSNQPGPPGKTRTVLKAGARKIEVPNDRSEPIVFKVQVEPVSADTAPAADDPPLKRGEQRCVVHFVVPARDVVAEKVDGNTGTDEVGVAVVAFDQNGERVAKRMLKLTMGVHEDIARNQPNAALVFNETVNLPRGRNYLYLGVWDMTSGRMGTVNAEFEVAKPGAKEPTQR